MSRPVPLPRTQIFCPDRTEDDKPLQCSSSPQSPTKSPEGGSVCSTPPPVSPKKWTVRKISGRFDSVNGSLELVKVTVKDVKSLADWQERFTSLKYLCIDLKFRGEKETKIIKVKTDQIYEAIQVYILLLSEHGGTLKEHISELLCIADNLDKVSKGTKIAGITGGATTIAGGVAAAAGVILSPFTLGASLALTAVGIGMAAAGGVTGLSAGIANKVSAMEDKKKIEKTFQEYKLLMESIQDCLKFINGCMGQLKKHDLSVLSEARMDSERVARVIQLATTGGASAKAIEANSKVTGLIEGFTLGMEMYFTQGKDGQKLKKGLKTKFAKNIRKVAEELIKGLDELKQIKDLFSENFSGE